MNRPIQKWRIGNIECAVWENKKTFNGGEVSYKTMTLSRSYKKKDEEIWRSEAINSLRRNDIAKLIAILQKAQDYLFFEDIKPHEDGKEEGNEEEDE